MNYRLLLFVIISIGTLFLQDKNSVEGRIRDLLRLDCQAKVHFLPDTPFGTIVDAQPFKAILESFYARVLVRAKAKCPSITRKEIKRRFVPSLDMIMNYISGESKRDNTTSCKDMNGVSLFADNILSLGPYINAILGGDKFACDSNFQSTFINAEGILPDSCLENFRQTGRCSMKMGLQPEVSGIDIQVAVGTCSETQATPYLSLTCGGDNCEFLGKPCTASDQCGSMGQCDDFAALIPAQAGDISIPIADGLTEGGIWHSSIPKGEVWNLIIKKLRAYWGNTDFYPTSTPTSLSVDPNSPISDQLKFCMPKQAPGRSFVDYIKILADTTTCSPTVPPTKNPTVTQSPTVEQGAGRLLRSILPSKETIEAASTIIDHSIEMDTKHYNGDAVELLSAAKNAISAVRNLEEVYFDPSCNQYTSYQNTYNNNNQCDSYKCKYFPGDCSGDACKGCQQCKPCDVSCGSSTSNCGNNNCQGCNQCFKTCDQTCTFFPSNCTETYKCGACQQCQYNNNNNGPSGGSYVGSDSYCKKGLDINYIFRTFNGLDFHCESSSKVLFETVCPVNQQRCPFNTRIRNGDPNSGPFRCDANSNGQCNFAWVGNGVCDPQCNIPGCSFDGGDCNNAVADVFNQDLINDYETCHRMLFTPNNTCIDPVEKAGECKCTEERLQGYWSNFNGTFSDRDKYCQPGNPLAGCCFCKGVYQQETYQNSKRNQYAKINEVSMTCNHVATWDGALNGDRYVFDPERMGLVTDVPFPDEWYSKILGETKLIDFDCEGYLSFGVVLPFLRGKFYGMLRSFKAIEDIFMGIVAARQANENGPALVDTNSGKPRFTPLGYRAYGVATIPNLFYQLSEAYFEPRDSNFNFYFNQPKKPAAMKLLRNDTTIDWVVDFPQSCTLQAYQSNGRCVIQYRSPALQKIHFDLPLTANVARCPGTEIPKMQLTAGGPLFKQWPFHTPCSTLDLQSCPQHHNCVDIMEFANTQGFLNDNRKLSDIDYDILTYFLHGLRGRRPIWHDHHAPNASWVTEDFNFLFEKLFARAALPYEPFKNPRPVAFGTVPYCFPDGDPFFTDLLKTGKPYNWTYAGEGVVFTEGKSVSHPGYNSGKNVTHIKIIGMESTNVIPFGLTGFTYSPTQPTNKPTQQPLAVGQTHSPVTSAPTVPTTSSPTAPTNSPTEPPTEPEATESPTAPTNAPTNSPLTDGMTHSPVTQKPTTKKPTTKTPTIKPTIAPTLVLGNSGVASTISSIVIGAFVALCLVMM